MSGRSRNPIRRVAISTGGGDAPGLNAVIRAATLSALGRGWEVIGVRDGYNGLLSPERFDQGGIVPLDSEAVRGIAHRGGTILGTTNRGDPTRYPVEIRPGTWSEVDRSDELLDALAGHEIDALIAVGGDGSLAIAHHLHQRAIDRSQDLRVIGVPKTIDNDLDKTTATFGFDTAVSFACEAIDRLFSTAASHGRIMVVEVMGRYAGWIALSAGTASGAHAILIPEVPYRIERIAEQIEARVSRGSRYAIVVVAEGAVAVGGSRTVKSREIGRAERLGGVGELVARDLERLTGREARTVVLGHLLRGGTPTAFDRLLGLRFGAAAIRVLAAGEDGVMVSLAPPNVVTVPLLDATRRQKLVPLDGDTMLTARELGIVFGDEPARDPDPQEQAAESDHPTG